MSEPNENHANPFNGTLSELLSAMSSLNMNPDPVPAPPDSNGYLSETDGWAAHSMQHLHAAFANAQRAEAFANEAERRLRRILLDDLRYPDRPMLAARVGDLLDFFVLRRPDGPDPFTPPLEPQPEPEDQ